ncbi:DUF1127 domain-containing protein [Neomegalonema sp.]|uniref:DUF1127 domain-containing protein n=1 Tax=Neomegalonema sp. TaxID=2039713 RepID=UPI00262E6B6D|nr:DUF1127 domain-containing protein [Neomegalonema sp.]MDD2867238.1 DUF1127 domain-containing protein [Neomegalonema sp.]
MFKSIVSYFSRQAQSRALASELGSMTDRQLADIGLSRGDIDFVVQQSYGAQPEQQIVAGDVYGRNLARVSNLTTIYAGSRLA